MMASSEERLRCRVLSIAIARSPRLLGSLARAEAGIVVTVDKSAQRLSVAVDGFARYEWPVSTARWGYRTPNGSYRPERLERKWFSRKYDMSPMPYSIFFDGGYAIHGSYEISHLGSPASHGCIRLHPRTRRRSVRAGEGARGRHAHRGDRRAAERDERSERAAAHRRSGPRATAANATNAPADTARRGARAATSRSVQLNAGR